MSYDGGDLANILLHSKNTESALDVPKELMSVLEDTPSVSANSQQTNSTESRSRHRKSTPSPETTKRSRATSQSHIGQSASLKRKDYHDTGKNSSSSKPAAAISLSPQENAVKAQLKSLYHAALHGNLAQENALAEFVCSIDEHPRLSLERLVNDETGFRQRIQPMMDQYLAITAPPQQPIEQSPPPAQKATSPNSESKKFYQGLTKAEIEALSKIAYPDDWQDAQVFTYDDHKAILPKIPSIYGWTDKQPDPEFPLKNSDFIMNDYRKELLTWALQEHREREFFPIGSVLDDHYLFRNLDKNSQDDTLGSESWVKMQWIIVDYHDIVYHDGLTERVAVLLAAQPLPYVVPFSVMESDHPSAEVCQYGSNDLFNAGLMWWINGCTSKVWYHINKRLCQRGGNRIDISFKCDSPMSIILKRKELSRYYGYQKTDQGIVRRPYYAYLTLPSLGNLGLLQDSQLSHDARCWEYFADGDKTKLTRFFTPGVLMHYPVFRTSGHIYQAIFDKSGRVQTKTKVILMDNTKPIWLSDPVQGSESRVHTLQPDGTVGEAHAVDELYYLPACTVSARGKNTIGPFYCCYSLPSTNESESTSDPSATAALQQSTD